MSQTEVDPAGTLGGTDRADVGLPLVTNLHPGTPVVVGDVVGGEAVVATSFVGSVDETQLYYWTPAWQEHERAAVAELVRGEGRVFENGTDAVKWLLSEDE